MKLKQIKGKPKVVGEKCDLCHQNKPDVSGRIDPYSREINDEYIERNFCDDCFLGRVEDI